MSIAIICVYTNTEHLHYVIFTCNIIIIANAPQRLTY